MLTEEEEEELEVVIDDEVDTEVSGRVTEGDTLETVLVLREGIEVEEDDEEDEVVVIEDVVVF